jgi:coenzyme PQQ synthesis protein D (PqqD)
MPRRNASRRYRQAAGIEMREVAGEFFLVVPGPGTTHHLDKMASAVWRVLAEPRSAEELIDLFDAAFPNMPKRKIARDVENLLSFLEEQKLVVSVRDQPRR